MLVGIFHQRRWVNKVGIYAGYQVFGNEAAPSGRAKVELKDFQNLISGCGDYFVLHFWREHATGDDHCIVVCGGEDNLNIGFHADWLGGNLGFYQVPIDHQIEIGGGPNHERGSREYKSFTWYIHDKTANKYITETRDTPTTWTFKCVDVALEMEDLHVPNGKRKAMTKLVVLDKDLEPIHLPHTFGWVEWSNPNGCNCHEEIYTHNGYEVECWQWKTFEGVDAFSYWIQRKSGSIVLGDVTYLVMAYFQEIDLGFTPTLDNFIEIVRLYGIS
jgi:hypothetical protein